MARELEGEGIDVAPAGASDAARAVIAPSLAEAASVDAVLAAVPASVARAVLLVPLSPSGEAARAPWLEACARSGLSPVAPFDWSEVGKGVVHLARAGGAGATVDLLLDEVEALRARDGARRALERRAVEAEGRLRQVERSVGWRLLSAIRGLRARLAPPDSRIDGFYRALRRIAGEVLERGVRASLRHPVRLLRGPEGAYARWRAREERGLADPAALLARAAAIAPRPLVSVLTPVYDTREADLRAAVASVRAQAYDAWELVLVDDGSKAPHVRGLLDELAASDPRVRVVRLPKNLGIAGASQHALEAAHGSLTALLDHDDALAPDALLEMVLAFSLDPAVDVAYSDEDKLDARGRRFEPFFKPAWDPVLLLGVNYVGHLFVARTDLLRAVGGFRRGFDGSQDHDLFLRATERARGVAHVPRVLYHWRTAPGSTAALEEAKPASMAAARRAVEEAIVRRGEVARVVEIAPHRLSPRYDPGGDPAVTVVVRATAGASRALRCVERLRAEPRGGRLEVIVVHDGAAARANEDASAIHVAGPAGAARVAQLALGARRATGEVLLLLDEGFEAATGGWLEEMLGHARRPEVGAVGAKLLRPDGRIRSAGLTLGTRGLAGSAFAGLRGDRPHCFGLSDLARSVSAVSLRALMLRRDVYGAAGGLDEALDAFADVDLCLRIAARGLRIVQASQAALRIEGPEAPRDTRSTEGRVVRERWRAVLEAGDRYFPRALSREREDWTIA